MTKAYTQKELDDHIKDVHRLSPVSTYLKEVVYGGIDGIVTTFAVVAGFTGASAGQNVTKYSIITVLLFGLANLFADGTSMALGNVLSTRSNQKIYQKTRKKEAFEVRNNKTEEARETVFLLQKHGFEEKDAQTITQIYTKNETFWTDFMMHYELEMENPEGENPLYTGIATFSAFVSFGFIPLVPYLFISKDSGAAFLGSLIATAVALIVLGVVRFNATKEKPSNAIFETIILGSVSATVAYVVGLFFRG